MSTENVKEIVKEKYGNAALRVTSGDTNFCCGQDRAGLDGASDPITSNLYNATEEGEVPDTAIKASLGCGNPTALAELKPGEVVLDLGSGGGIDVLRKCRYRAYKGLQYRRCTRLPVWARPRCGCAGR
jgi:arsenite methyltransferase